MPSDFAPGDARTYHVPVMLEETIALLDPQPGKTIVDATLGGGGHAAAIAAKLAPGGLLIGIDQDADAIVAAQIALEPFGDGARLVQARFDSMGEALGTLGVERVDGILFDLGVSSYQLDTPERGFSFKEPSAPLDMRMNAGQAGPTAANLLNSLSERELNDLIRNNSDERWAARIARFVVERRRQTPYETVGQLVETVFAAMPSGARPDDKHAATRTFQALRIAVNDELGVLQRAIEEATQLLRMNGRIVVLTYHSLEDRIVKRHFARESGRGEAQGPYGARPAPTLELLTKRSVQPSAAEINTNHRARSARLRAAQRLMD